MSGLFGLDCSIPVRLTVSCTAPARVRCLFCDLQRRSLLESQLEPLKIIVWVGLVCLQHTANWNGIMKRVVGSQESAFKALERFVAEGPCLGRSCMY